jgi:ribosome-associated protein
VVILDLRKLSPIADFFVICTGVGDVHVKAISDAVEKGLQSMTEKHKAWHVEGYDTLRWVLLDYVNVVVHVFQQGTREYYSLEKFWGDAPREEMTDPLLERGGFR